MLGRHPQAELRHCKAPADVDVQDQLAVGTAAARRAGLPAWMLEAARLSQLSHVLLITSSTGAMELRTGMSQVVGSDPPENEASDPWRFMTRQQKAQALEGMLRGVFGRCIQRVVATV